MLVLNEWALEWMGMTYSHFQVVGNPEIDLTCLAGSFKRTLG